MKKLNPKEKMLLKYFLIFAGLAGIFQFFILEPLRHKIQFQKQEIVRINEEIQQAYNFLKDLNKIRKEAGEMEEHWQYFKRKLPDSKQIPSLLNNLAQAASRAHITYVSITTQPLERQTASEGVGLVYDKLPIEVNIRCRYKNLGEYLDYLKKLPRLVKVESLSVRRNEEILPEVEVTLGVCTFIIVKEG